MRGSMDRAALAASMQRPGTRAGVLALVAWSLAWKGASLWRAAKDDSKPWFGALLVTNTLGVLDAIYLFGVRRGRRQLEREEAEIRARTGEPEQLGHRQET
ncbi:DUF5652 family protein [Agrococcus sp. HG114]|uniref:DUF5652 family protein n=1 Tax=Agrococcus sp. HG114 TaxID=2969757 RepID=UPI00215A7971|nr:DUF5652 family protein [Agrococcus sp. HG114]MCR8671053.1 DUF5652 family protein [Agrococcus sp. HG114]